MGEFIIAKLGIGPQEGMKAQSLTAVPPIKIDFPVFLFWVFLCGIIDFENIIQGVKEELGCKHFNPHV